MLLYLNVKLIEDYILTNAVPNSLSSSSVNFHAGNKAPAASKQVHLSLHIEICGANLLLIQFRVFCWSCHHLQRLHCQLEYILLH